MKLKIIASVITAAIITLAGWVGKSIITTMGDIKVASTNIANCTKSLDKLADRYDSMDEKYNSLQNNIVELKIRLEMSKLESMEYSLVLSEQLELLKKYTSKIPLSGSGNIFDVPPPKPTPAGDYEDLKYRVLEQRKIVESLEKP